MVSKLVRACKLVRPRAQMALTSIIMTCPKLGSKYVFTHIQLHYLKSVHPTLIKVYCLKPNTFNCLSQSCRARLVLFCALVSQKVKKRFFISFLIFFFAKILKNRAQNSNSDFVFPRALSDGMTYWVSSIAHHYTTVHTLVTLPRWTNSWYWRCRSCQKWVVSAPNEVQEFTPKISLPKYSRGIICASS